MDFGVLLPNTVPTTRRNLLECCRRIDDGPFGSLAIGERIGYDTPDNFVVLSAAAAVTSRVRIMTFVLVLPLHPAALVAKRAATLDMVSDGRLTLGIGLGERIDDYRAAEAEKHWEQKFDAVEEKVDELRRIWSGERPPAGQDVVGPPPVQPGGPPIFWGGTRFGPKALRRVMKLNPAGFLGFTPSADPTDLATIYGRIIEAWEEAGRTGRPYILTSFFFALGDDARERMARGPGRYLHGGTDVPLDFATGEASAAGLTITSEEALRRAIDNVEAAGFDGITFLPPADDPDDIDRLAAVLGSR